MLPFSAKDTIRFTPDDRAEDARPPVYLVKVPTQLERAAWRRDVRAAGAEFPGDLARLAVMREGIETMASPERAAELLPLIDEAVAAIRSAPREIHLDPPALEAVSELLRQHYPKYAALLAERGYWLEVAPWVAAQCFLVGWENVDDPERSNGVAVDLPFARKFGRVPDLLLEKLPIEHVVGAGWKAIGAMTLSRSAEKNSASPQPSLPSPRNTSPSASTAPSPADGSSSTSSSSATPGSS